MCIFILQHVYNIFNMCIFILQHVYNIFNMCIIHSTSCSPHVDVGEVAVHVDVSILDQLCGKLRGQGGVEVCGEIPQGISQSQLQGQRETLMRLGA